MTGMPRLPIFPLAMIGSSRSAFAEQCAKSAVKDGEKIIDRIAFWMGFGWCWQVDRLADRLEKICDEIEDFLRVMETKTSTKVLQYPPEIWDSRDAIYHGLDFEK